MDLAFRVHVCEDCGLDVPSFIADPLTTDEEFALAFLAAFDEAAYAIELCFVDEGTDGRFWFIWVSNIIGFGEHGFLVLLNEFLVDAFLHINAGGGKTDLACVCGDGVSGPSYSVIEVTIIEDYCWGFAS